MPRDMPILNHKMAKPCENKITHIAGLVAASGKIRPVTAWSVYLICCIPSPDKLLVKIGVSGIVYERVRTLRVAIPYPIDCVLHARAGDKWTAYKLERTLHKAFEDKRTTREWFEFDMATDKEEFNQTCSDVYRSFVGGPLKWGKIFPNQIDAYERDYVWRKNQKAASARTERNRDRRQEYGEYRQR